VSSSRPPALDLSGFTAVAPPPAAAPVPADTPPAPVTGTAPVVRPAASRPRSVAPAAPPAAPRPAGGGLKRVSLNVPAALVEAARRRADAEAVYLADVVVDALATHAVTVEAAVTARPVARRVGRPRRQRDVHHPTQLVVALTADERALLDGGAARCGLTRSAFATAVLRAALGTDA
jgi:hypothetical protein